MHVEGKLLLFCSLLINLISLVFTFRVLSPARLFDLTKNEVNEVWELAGVHNWKGGMHWVGAQDQASTEVYQQHVQTQYVKLDLLWTALNALFKIPKIFPNTVSYQACGQKTTIKKGMHWSDCPNVNTTLHFYKPQEMYRLYYRTRKSNIHQIYYYKTKDIITTVETGGGFHCAHIITGGPGFDYVGILVYGGKWFQQVCGLGGCTLTPAPVTNALIEITTCPADILKKHAAEVAAAAVFVDMMNQIEQGVLDEAPQFSPGAVKPQHMRNDKFH